MTHALVIGAGPAGLMAAEVLSAAGVQVTLADQMPSVGRKFLMAGKSGLNLTMDAPMAAFLPAYSTVPAHFRDAISAFGPQEVQAWACAHGQEIFTGPTGRVFPKVMKASPLLRAVLAKLVERKVTILTRHKWVGWDHDSSAQFETPAGITTLLADATILALGGASWPRLGSDGAWAAHLHPIAPFKPANCGFELQWTPHMAPHFGQPMKATRLSAGNLSSRGEWIITAEGIEGGGVYTISTAVRDGATLTVDLAPDITLQALEARLANRPRKASRQVILKKVLRLSPIKAALFNEFTPPQSGITSDRFAERVKALPFPQLKPAPIESAISTSGGLRFDDLTSHFMLKGRPGVFAAGEMLDWEAPTGGYLITGCLATGRRAAQSALDWLARGS